MNSGKLTTFHLFPKLPMELRLMIWEFTWLASRVIEAAYYEDPDAEEFKEITILRLGGTLSKFLRRDFGSRILQDKPLQYFNDPVALWVCYESRQHTLRKYTCARLRHSEFKAASFWFSPRYDFLWLSQDATDNMENIEDIEDYYGDHLKLIENVMVQDLEWTDTTPAAYTENYLLRLENIKNLFVLYANYDNKGQVVRPHTNLQRLSKYDRNKYARWEEVEEEPFEMIEPPVLL